MRNLYDIHDPNAATRIRRTERLTTEDFAIATAEMDGPIADILSHTLVHASSVAMSLMHRRHHSQCESVASDQRLIFFGVRRD
jgi:hypothetical protein